MLLKSTLTPLYATLPSKTRHPNLSRTITRFTITQQSTQTVRQNASTKTPTSQSPSLLLLHKLPPKSAYIHLPFCRKRCHYCDFPIIALGSSSSTSPSPPPANDDDPRIVNYIETLCREIKATPSNFAPHPPLETVFFGGGTPSLVPPKLVSLVLETLSSKFSISANAEVSMEMDPGTFDRAKMAELMSFGVNRVSLGVQAFQDDLLKACGRAHGVKEVHEMIEIVKGCGVENWSMDVISSLPHQTMKMWEESLRLTVQAQPAHVSVYDLQVEQGTKFGNLYSPGEFPLPSENQSAEFYRTASRMLGEAGYGHYEISSYCKSGFRCKHNSTYWNNRPFYAFGLGSASYINGVRFSRPRRLKDYSEFVQKLEYGLVNGLQDNVVDDKDLAMDVLMLSLRTSDGLDLRAFSEAFGGELVRAICKVYKPYVESGHVISLDEHGRRIREHEFSSLISDEKIDEVVAVLRLSDPDGFLLSNELISLAFGVVSP